MGKKSPKTSSVVTPTMLWAKGKNKEGLLSYGFPRRKAWGRRTNPGAGREREKESRISAVLADEMDMALDIQDLGPAFTKMRQS